MYCNNILSKKYKPLKINNNSGFSLVELAIVLLVAGIVTAGIAAGSHLMQAAKLNRIISEFSGYAKATNNFKDKYKAWPGDMPNAVSYWGTYNSSTNPNGVVNGDGDELIAWNSEGVRAWQEMALAGLISGKYTGVLGGTPAFTGGSNVPASSVNGGMYIFSSLNLNTIFMNSVTNALLLAKIDSPATAANSSVLTVADAYLIDKKIDDGNPSDGYFYSTRGADVAAGNCTTFDYGTDTKAAAYDLGNNNLSSIDALVCRPLYVFNKDS